MANIYLRRLEKEDLPRLFFYRNDPRIYKWCRQNDVLHRSRHEAWFDWQAQDKNVSMYVIAHEEDGEVSISSPIGVCGLTDIDRVNRRAEFSLYIATDSQRYGYGKKALSLLLDKAFNVENLNVVWGETFAGNPAAKLFEELGFIKEGTRRQFYFRKGGYIDAHLYSITRLEWMKSLR